MYSCEQVDVLPSKIAMHINTTQLCIHTYICIYTVMNIYTAQQYKQGAIHMYGTVHVCVYVYVHACVGVCVYRIWRIMYNPVKFLSVNCFYPSCFAVQSS